MDDNRRKQLFATLSSVVRLPWYTAGDQRHLMQSVLRLCSSQLYKRWLKLTPVNSLPR